MCDGQEEGGGESFVLDSTVRSLSIIVHVKNQMCRETVRAYLKLWVVVVVLVAKSCPTLVTPWSVALQALLSMGFFREEY